MYFIEFNYQVNVDETKLRSYERTKWSGSYENERVKVTRNDVAWLAAYHSRHCIPHSMFVEHAWTQR